MILFFKHLMKIVVYHEFIKQKVIKIKCKTIFLNIFLR